MHNPLCNGSDMRRDNDLGVTQQMTELQSLVVDELPETDEDAGLCGSNVESRIPFLEALRRVVVRWPMAPVVVRERTLQSGDKRGQVEVVEAAIWDFYSQAFYTQFSRPPCVLSFFPFSALFRILFSLL